MAELVVSVNENRYHGTLWGDDRVEIHRCLYDDEALETLRQLAVENNVTIPASSNNQRSLINKLISKFNRGEYWCRIPCPYGYYELTRYDDNKTTYIKRVFEDKMEGLRRMAVSVGFKIDPKEKGWDAKQFIKEIKKFIEKK